MQPLRIVRRHKLKEVCILVFLGINAWMDVKKQEVSLVTAGVFSVLGLFWLFYSGESLRELVIPLGTGALFLALSVVTKGAVGLGDVWILMALGIMLRTERFLWTLCIGMLLAGGWALVLLVAFKKNRHTELPFVPFLLAGYVGGLILW